MIDVAAFKSAVTHAPSFKLYGRVTKVTGMVLESIGPVTMVGELCKVVDPKSGESHTAEVIGFNDNRVLLMPLTSTVGIKLGDLVEASGEMPEIRVGKGLLGRILNGLGQPIDDKGALNTDKCRSIHAKPINPMQRKPIDQTLSTGVRLYVAIVQHL